MDSFLRIVVAVTALIAFPFHIMGDTPKVLKVAVTSRGQINVNGSPTTLEALAPLLSDLAKNKGEVWYYRDAPKEEPHPNALKVLSAIIDHNLPVRLSSKPDYSDTIDDKRQISSAPMTIGQRSNQSLQPSAGREEKKRQSRNES
jgi:hypothetical protein